MWGQTNLNGVVFHECSIWDVTRTLHRDHLSGTPPETVYGHSSNITSVVGRCQKPMMSRLHYPSTYLIRITISTSDTYPCFRPVGRVVSTGSMTTVGCTVTASDYDSGMITYLETPLVGR